MTPEFYCNQGMTSSTMSCLNVLWLAGGGALMGGGT